MSLSYHSSNLLLIALETMRLLVLITWDPKTLNQESDRK